MQTPPILAVFAGAFAGFSVGAAGAPGKPAAAARAKQLQ